MGNIICIDIGGTFTKAGLVKNNAITYKIQKPTIKNNEKGFVTMLFNIIDELLAKKTGEKVSGIGIAIAGMVLADKGILLSAANLGLKNLDISKIIIQKYKIPTKIGNDVSMFALAQSHLTNIKNLAYIAIGTGINIGVVNNGRLFAGADGASIEYGHTSLMTKQKPQHSCPCGLNNCVECFVSGKALMNAAQKNGFTALRPEDVFDKYSLDKTAKEIIDDFIFYLSAVLLNISNSYRPQKIFIGGGLAQSIAPFIKSLNQDLKKKHYGYIGCPPLDIEISNISSDGGILGAALLF